MNNLRENSLSNGRELHLCMNERLANGKMINLGINKRLTKIISNNNLRHSMLSNKLILHLSVLTHIF